MAQSTYKYDTSINWAKAKNFTPKLDELIYYTDLNNFKKGDGKTKVNDLPFYVQIYNGESQYLKEEQ